MPDGSPLERVLLTNERERERERIDTQKIIYRVKTHTHTHTAYTRHAREYVVRMYLQVQVLKDDSHADQDGQYNIIYMEKYILC